MARLPNANKAIIDPDKLYGYILSPTHPVGRFKAAFFRKIGYSSENWEVFEQNLRYLIITQDATEVEPSRYGKKFTVTGSFAGPYGDTTKVVSVWTILRGEDIPRLVTVYPGE